MNNEPTTAVTVAPEQSSAIQVAKGDNIELTAATPAGMAECQNSMIQWSERKVALMQAEQRELQQAYELAIKRKWKSETLKRHAAIAAKRVTFYEKILAALKAGYYIVPSFPVTLFAIRTEKESPKHMYCVVRHSASRNFQQEPQVLEQGKGEYQDPNPLVRQSSFMQKDDDGKEKGYQTWADSWAEMEFPTNMSKPYIMEATDRAMALKIFDEIGVLPQDFKRNPDPIIAGRIIDPRPSGYGEPRKVTFLICWHLDTKTL